MKSQFLLKNLNHNFFGKKIFFKFSLSVFFLFFQSFYFFAQNYPVIPELKSQDEVFSQYEDEILSSNKTIAYGNIASLNLYSYKATRDDTVFTVAARCSIPYDSLVTANSLENSQVVLTGKLLVLPTVCGIFIPEKPDTAIEILLAKEHSVELISNNYPVYTINGRKFYFMQNTRFSPTERAFFLDSSFRLPLDKNVLTSSFGMRVSPISGKWKFHSGIDMAATVGTNVYSCKSGTVNYTGFNEVYGNYIILMHQSGITSVYAHLSKILVQKNQIVSSGEVIGKVGVTGETTGPHLHFEIRVNGTAQNPEQYFE